MKFCHNCGVCVENEQQYCIECGVNLTTISSDSPNINSSNKDASKKTIKVMNIIALCLTIPYILTTCALAIAVDFDICYTTALLWPIPFVLFLFFLVVYIKKSNYSKKKAIILHLVFSIVSLSALVLGGIIMFLLSYGTVVFPFASSIINIVIGYKMNTL